MGEDEPEPPERVKDPASVELGRLGGLIGGYRGSHKIAASDPKLFAEASSVLTREFETLGERHVRAELVITGAGPTFRGPAPRN